MKKLRPTIKIIFVIGAFLLAFRIAYTKEQESLVYYSDSDIVQVSVNPVIGDEVELGRYGSHVWSIITRGSTWSSQSSLSGIPRIWRNPGGVGLVTFYVKYSHLDANEMMELREKEKLFRELVATLGQKPSG